MALRRFFHFALTQNVFQFLLKGLSSFNGNHCNAYIFNLKLKANQKAVTEKDQVIYVWGFFYNSVA